MDRRHLTTTQRAALAVDLLPPLEERARERQGARTDLPNIPAKLPESYTGRESRDEAAALVGVSPRYVSDAKRIQREAPELVDRMRDGQVSMAEAKREVAERGSGPDAVSPRASWCTLAMAAGAAVVVYPGRVAIPSVAAPAASALPQTS